MATIIAWDIEKFSHLTGKLDQCMQVLEAQKNVITNLRAVTEDNWVSAAGREYATRINEDLQNLDDILQKFRTTKTELEDANQKYAAGEVEVHDKLIQLYRDLSVVV